MAYDPETLVPCPACETCQHCKGTTRITCHRCPVPHAMPCPYGEACGVCQGMQLVTAEQRALWIRNPPPETPRSA